MKRSEAIENARQAIGVMSEGAEHAAAQDALFNLLEHIDDLMYPGDDTLVGDEPVSNPDKLPRLVPVEREHPTLDQMPEGIRHEIADKYGDASDTFVGFRVGDDAYRAADSQGELPAAMRCGGPARQFAVLDAEPQQQTVNDLRSGDVAKVDGMWMLCTSQFNFVMLGGTHSGYFRSPRRDTPIGHVYRFEV